MLGEYDAGYENCIDSMVRQMEDMQFRIDNLHRENDKLRELARRLLTEYRYMRVRPRRVYLEHEGRMRAIEEEMRELGVEVGE